VPAVACIGSLNVDLVVRVTRMPGTGETVTGHALERHLGGKGLNQALAAARAGGDVALVGAVGTDEGGEWMRRELGAEGVDLTAVADVDGPSGTALIEVDAGGANRIVVIPGANGWLTAVYTAEQVRRLRGDHVPADPTPSDPALHISVPPGGTDSSTDAAAVAGPAGRASSGVALAPLEVPPDAVLGALREAHAAGMLTILNTAPVPPDGLPDGLLAVTDIVVANEHEAGLITGITVKDMESAYAAARALRDQGAGGAIVTLGADGAVWSTGDGHGHTPAYPVTPIDTVAAGDAFCGVLAASLAEGLEWTSSLRRASAAGALATTVAGAAPSLPSAAAIARLMEDSPAGDSHLEDS
jgi:ribokinase